MLGEICLDQTFLIVNMTSNKCFSVKPKNTLFHYYNIAILNECEVCWQKKFGLILRCSVSTNLIGTSYNTSRKFCECFLETFIAFLSIGQVFFRIWVFSYPQNSGLKRKNTIRENTNLAHFTRWIYVTSLWHFYPNVSHKVSAVGIKEMHTFEEMQETFISLMIDKFIIIHRG